MGPSRDKLYHRRGLVHGFFKKTHKVYTTNIQCTLVHVFNLQGHKYTQQQNLRWFKQRPEKAMEQTHENCGREWQKAAIS